jgi:GDP-D-mannose 3', 5'-epimerase
MVTISQLAELTMRFAGKQFRIRHIHGPLGMRGRKSDNRLIARELNWVPSVTLEQGLRSNYEWINSQVEVGIASTGRGRQ